MNWDPHIDAEGLDPLEFEALLPVYEQVREDDPNDLVALRWLGHAYTRLGRIQEGLEVDLRLVELIPNEPVAWYNLGCSFAMLGQKGEALEALERAAVMGFADPDAYRADPDLESLRKDRRFLALLERLEREEG